MSEQKLREYNAAYNLYIATNIAIMATFIMGPCTLAWFLLDWKNVDTKIEPIIVTLIFLFLLILRKNIRERMETKKAQLEEEYTRAAEAKLRDQQQS